jgi:predicted nucleic-acid-binding Zn-ribbon protein
MSNSPCPKCGCTVIVEGVRILDRGSRGHTEDLSLAAYRHPDAWLFKGEVLHRLWAKVCGNCGFTELYAENPTDLLRAVAEAQAAEEPKAPTDATPPAD